MYTEEHITQYLVGQMSPEETKAFEEEMARDGELQKRVQRERHLIAAINLEGKEMFKARVGQVVRADKRRRMWFILGAIALLSLVGYMGYTDGQKPKEEVPIEYNELFASNYTLPDLALAQRGEADANLVKMVDDAYGNKEFEKITAIVTKVGGMVASNNRIKMITGIAYMEQQKWDEALALFDQIAYEDDIQFTDAALWYGALCHLRKKDDTKAKDNLSILARDNSRDYYKEAKALLKRL